MRPKLLEEEKRFIGYCQSVFKGASFYSKYNNTKQLYKTEFFKRLRERIIKEYTITPK